MIELDAATVLLQWATGGLLFMWVTTRRRELSLGYGWLMRGIFILLAAFGVVSGFRYGLVLGRELAQIGVVVAATVALGMSVIQRKAGVSGHMAEHDRRSERVAAMTGIERTVEPRSGGADTKAMTEFDPRLDLIAPVLGVVGLVFAGAAAGGNDALAIARTLAGAAFLGAVTDAMLLGHWYLVQPGLKRGALVELVRWVGYIWPVEVGLLLVPTGMISVWTGAIDDGYQGILGWFWGVSAITTIVLVFLTMAALKERYYSAVMAATGLLYLAILTAFGTDLIARALLASP
ncbi:MAG: hypothetical protein GXP35_16950 [Actinobacteria bacterium]|nr:hypothetical protein [Actinomycetota bacterium]